MVMIQEANKEAFEYFVAWTLSPRSCYALDERNQEDLAKKLGVTRQTLNNWSKSEEFVEYSKIVSSGLAQLRKNRIEAEAYDSALANGWQDKAFFMKCFAGWSEKSSVEVGVISLSDYFRIKAEKAKNEQIEK